MLTRFIAAGSVLVIGLFFPSAGTAQEPVPIGNQPGTNPPAANAPAPSAPPAGTVAQSPGAEFSTGGGPSFGPGHFHSGWPYGPRIAPAWSYPGLAGGPYITYPWGYSPGSGVSCLNVLSRCSPSVPVYGPVPTVFGGDLTQQWRTVPSPGLPFGWVGKFAASPRPRPLTVSVWPTAQRGPAVAGPIAAPAAQPGGCLVLSVRVPQPGAEVFVDGVKTTQTGTDRLFESPRMELGKEFKYEVTARWLERGTVREVKRAVVGTPGEVVKVDFTAGDVIATGK